MTCKITKFKTVLFKALKLMSFYNKANNIDNFTWKALGDSL